jgi:RNA polymerase sigma-70 factor (ECF subfamily)
LRRTTLERNSTRRERFERLYEEHVEAVRRYAWRRDPSIADDVVAETFLVAWRRLDDVPESAGPWLIGVARNVRLNLRRGRRRQEAVAQRLVDASPPPFAGDTSREAELVRGALARLAPRDREVLLLAVWDDLDRAAIAQVLGCSKANASLRLHRARRRFAAAVEELDEGRRATVSRSLIHGGADV